jgi:membrane associated rhomboid family serine protease
MSNFRPGGFQQLPVVVKNIIIINVLVFLLDQLLQSRGIHLDDYLALHYWQSPMFRWWQPLTHMFMHGSIEHIAFNMFGLWMFGRVIESLWTPQRFLLFYLVCGLGAAFCHLGVLYFEFSSFNKAFVYYQQHPTLVEYSQMLRHQNLDKIPVLARIQAFWNDNRECTNCYAQSRDIINQYYAEMIDQATVGASGAVFGILFAFAYLFPNTDLFILFLPIPVKAKWVVTVYALIELYSGVQNSAGDNIAHFAHLGGMLFAFLMLRIWKANIRNNFY